MARPRTQYRATNQLIDAQELGIMGQRVVVQSVNSFPLPVDGVITLVDNTAYLINGTVDISPNRIVCGRRNAILGTDRLNDILTSSTPDALISLGPGDLSLLINSVKIMSPNGALFNVTSSGLSCSESSLAGASFGTFATVGSLTFRQTAFLNAFTVSGATFSGAHTGTLRFFENTVTNSAGTLLDFGASTFSLIDISRNLVTCNAAQTFISGQPANASFSGVISRNTKFAGVGTFAIGIAAGDTNWLFTENVGIANDPVGGDVVWGGITGTLTNQTDLQTALNLKANTASLGTLATQNGTFSGTSSGTNTGDQDLSGLMVKANNLSDVANVGTAKTNLGLNNVDNTSDANKPVSTAAQTALNLKANTASLGTLATQNGTFSGTSSGTNTGDQTNISGNAATVTTNANLTGVVTSTGNATSIANGAISNAMLANGAVANLSGTNTGDNATNTQYSGLAASKQDTLVSGTNIKTINGSTVLGSGNIVVSGSAPVFTVVTKDVGVGRSGTFDITGLSGLTADKPVTVMQTSDPITSKGNARDEPEMDMIQAVGYALDTTSIRVTWNSPSIVVGEYNFGYMA